MVLNDKSVHEMQSKQFDNENYGLGLFLGTFDSHKIISHGGTLPGFTSYYLIDLETKVGGVRYVQCRGNKTYTGRIKQIYNSFNEW